MLIASIDLMNGKAVQLVQGKRKVLERDNPLELAREYGKLGEIAVIDLDAAMGNGNNKELIQKICSMARCRVGGGIGSVQQAKEYVAMGAEKIIIGSKGFENNRVNVDFLKDLARGIGKERILVAVDARDGEIVVNGWKTGTGLRVVESATILAPYVSGLLFTCVEREGKLNGTDMTAIRELRKVFAGSITAAGGITTTGELKT